MPKVYKENLLASKKEEQSLPSPLDTLELPDGEDYHPDDYLPDTVRTLASWEAPSRTHRKKDRSYYITLVILAVLFTMIALLMGYALLALAIISLLFVVYVLNFVIPEDIKYKISTQGVTVGEHFYHWQELDSFWFTKKDGFSVLNIITEGRFPPVLMIVLGDMSEDKIKRICANYLPFHEIPPQTVLDKWSEKLIKYFPLENPHH